MTDATTRCHVLIRGGQVLDGSGEVARYHDIAIESDRIVAVGKLQYWCADTVIDARGKTVAPGFIDVHTHDERALLDTPSFIPKLSQGVTSVIAGNCGISIAPFRSDHVLPPPMNLLGSLSDYTFPDVASYRDAFQAARPALNLALLTGHGSLRVQAMGDAYVRSANDAEIMQMQTALERALQQGSIGLSTGLAYPNSRAASTDEVVKLANVMRDYPHTVYASHIRDEANGVVQAVEEALEIGRRSKNAVVLSHHKCAGVKNYGRTKQTLALIAERMRTQSITLDVYPYTASSTVLLPEYIKNSEKILVSFSERYPEMNQHWLHDIADIWHCDQAEAARRLAPAGAIYFQIDEQDLRRVLAFPHTMIGSDGIPSMTHPHPRLWGTFPRILGHYVRELGLLSLQDAVRRMTGLAADNFGLRERGYVRPGYYADLVLFDPAQIIDKASFTHPKQQSEGIDMVMVNGRIAHHKGLATRERNGRFLAR